MEEKLGEQQTQLLHSMHWEHAALLFESLQSLELFAANDAAEISLSVSVPRVVVAMMATTFEHKSCTCLRRAKLRSLHMWEKN